MRLSKWTSVLLGGVMLAGCHKEPAATKRLDSPPIASPAPAPRPAGPGTPAVTLPGGKTIADVAAKVTPSVVSVFSERTTRSRMSSYGDPMFDYFFGNRFRAMPERNLGSGVIVGADGVILTNNHVIANADKIRVALHDGRELDAKVVGTDPESDVAVLRIAAKNLPAIDIADSSRIRIGDLVLAVGNPFGIGQTVTMGIISAVGRANMGITDYEDFIQTDAAINPGNSGGALVDMDGKLVGINTAIASRSGGYQGIGFAIPSNMAMQIKTAILADGKVRRGWLGVSIQDVTPQLAASLQLGTRRGVLISDVTKDSPAAKAGIRRGDVITAIDGRAIATSAQLRNTVALAGGGKQLRFEALRDGKPRTFDVTLVETPRDPRLAGGGRSTTLDKGLLGGVTVQALDAEKRRRLRAPQDLEGVVVTAIDPNSDAAALGLQEGDVIVELNRKPTKSVEAFTRAAQSSARSVVLLVYRDGATLFLSLQR